jgi:flavin reductase (DIM6/NTAB) family NADH-FMN oxidoreductase RutF
MTFAETAKAFDEHVFTPSAGTERSYRNALGTFATGVTVVTTSTPDGPIGITVNSFASVSLDPPLVLWSPAKNSSRHKVFIEASHFAIHVLSAEQHSLSSLFTRGGRCFDKVPWHENPEGVPVISGTLGRFECRLASIHDAGDHTIVIGHVLRAAHREGEPLCVSRGAYGRFAMAAG